MERGAWGGPLCAGAASAAGREGRRSHASTCAANAGLRTNAGRAFSAIATPRSASCSACSGCGECSHRAHGAVVRTGAPPDARGSPPGAEPSLLDAARSVPGSVVWRPGAALGSPGRGSGTQAPVNSASSARRTPAASPGVSVETARTASWAGRAASTAGSQRARAVQAAASIAPIRDGPGRSCRQYQRVSCPVSASRVRQASSSASSANSTASAAAPRAGERAGRAALRRSSSMVARAVAASCRSARHCTLRRTSTARSARPDGSRSSEPTSVSARSRATTSWPSLVPAARTVSRPTRTAAVTDPHPRVAPKPDADRMGMNGSWVPCSQL